MFRDNLTDAEFQSAMNRQDWSGVSPECVHHTAHEAISRSIPFDDLPELVAAEAREIIEDECHTDVPQINPVAWLEDHYEPMAPRDFVHAVASVTHIVGRGGRMIEPDDTDENGGQRFHFRWDHEEDADISCVVQVTQHGVWLNRPAAYTVIGFGIVGYCYMNNVGVVTYREIEKEIADSKATEDEVEKITGVVH